MKKNIPRARTTVYTSFGHTLIKKNNIPRLETRLTRLEHIGGGWWVVVVTTCKTNTYKGPEKHLGPRSGGSDVLRGERIMF